MKKIIIILVATITFLLSCKQKKNEDDYDVIIVKVPKFETIQRRVNSNLSNIDTSTKEITIDNSTTIDKSSINNKQSDDDEYSKALERIDLSGFSKEEIQAIKRDKPVQIWEPYCGQY